MTKVRSQKSEFRSQKFQKVIGTGGIGTGFILRLKGNANIRRNESRAAYQTKQRDYCKLHIILHYVSKLSRDLKLGVQVLPVGAVGDDDKAKRLVSEMQTAGMQTKYVFRFKKIPTLFSACYQFPDGSGGNLTEGESASSKLSVHHVQKVAKEIKSSAGKCIVLAAPEVPLKTRIALLKFGRKHGALNVASFTSEEAASVIRNGVIKSMDLISINIDEAAAVASLSMNSDPKRILKACVKKLTSLQPHIVIFVTHGARGAYGFAGGKMEFVPGLRVKAVNTAGGGDAFLAGLMLGKLRGLPWFGATGCLRLARLISAMSTISPDTIHFGINKRSLKLFADRYGERKLMKAFLK